MSIEKIKQPFAYFGAKSRISSTVWKAFGNVANYVEPFAGSLSILLNNPSIPKIETVNDIDCALINWWRAVSQNPEETAKFAKYPVSEIDLHARHKFLVEAMDQSFKDKMNEDPLFCNYQYAGWWVWGISSSIGNNWMQPKGLKALPILSSAGGGINGLQYNIEEQFAKLQVRLQRVRMLSGDWHRIVSPAITYNNVGLGKDDITAVFLDPPYNMTGREKVYSNDQPIYKEVEQWALSNSNQSKLRIALCGYENDYKMPNDWIKYSWQTNGGLANKGIAGQGKDNSKKEVVYFSPNCLET